MRRRVVRGHRVVSLDGAPERARRLRHRRPRDNVIALYKADGTFLDCNDDSGSIFRSELARDVRAGDSLLLQVGGKALGGGAFNQNNFSYAVSFAEDRDVDKDGYGVTPGPDCNDLNAAIHPGAADVANNGVDEDCANGDNVDGDGDHHGRKPGGDDCNDSNAGCIRARMRSPATSSTRTATARRRRAS